MIRTILLAMLLASSVVAGADFSFDVTSNGNDNWLLVPSAGDNIPQCDLLAAFSLSMWMTPGVDGTQENILSRGLVTSNMNYRVVDTSGNAYYSDASASGVSTDGYSNSFGASAAGTAAHVGVTFDSSVSAIVYVDGVASTPDVTVAATDDPAAGVRIGGNSTTISTVNVAASDHRGTSEGIAIYAVVLEAGEVSQLAHANSFRRPFRNRVLHMPLLGVPGVALDSSVKDWSPYKVNASATGTKPTYVPQYTRGAGR